VVVLAWRVFRVLPVIRDLLALEDPKDRPAQQVRVVIEGLWVSATRRHSFLTARSPAPMSPWSIRPKRFAAEGK
jgi:hypothetical protein